MLGFCWPILLYTILHATAHIHVRAIMLLFKEKKSSHSNRRKTTVTRNVKDIMRICIGRIFELDRMGHGILADVPDFLFCGCNICLIITIHRTVAQCAMHTHKYGPNTLYSVNESANLVEPEHICLDYTQDTVIFNSRQCLKLH